MSKKNSTRNGMRLLQIIFLVAFTFFIVLGILGILYEDDIPLAGFLWAGLIAVVYFFIKKLLFLRN